MLERIDHKATPTAFSPSDPNEDFHYVVAAFNAVVDHYLLAAVLQPPKDRMSVTSTCADLLKKNGSYSLAIGIKIFCILSIGALTSLFNLKPSEKAITEVLAKIILYYGGHLPHQPELAKFAQAMGVSRGVALSTYSATKLFMAYFPNQAKTKAEAYLIKEDASCLEKSVYYLRVVGSLISAGFANIPVFLFSLSLGIPLATAITLAAIANSWMGTNNLASRFRRYSPAHKVQLKFMQQQISTFSQLTTEEKQDFLKRIKQILEDGGEPELVHKKILLLLFTLNNPSKKLADNNWQLKILCGIFGSLGVISQLIFTESTVKGILNLSIFKNPRSDAAIASAVIGGIAAFPPAVGLGFGSVAAAKKLMSNTKPIANDYHPSLRKTSEFGLILWNILALGTIITFAYYCMRDLTNLANTKKSTAVRLEISFMFLCFIGSTISLSFYLISFLQMAFVFFALRNGKDNVRSEAAFQLGLDAIYNNIAAMSDKNFKRLLKHHWLSKSTPDDAMLADFYESLLQENLSSAEFRSLNREIKLTEMLSRTSLTEERSTATQESNFFKGLNIFSKREKAKISTMELRYIP